MASKRKMSAMASIVAGDAKRIKVGKHKQNRNKSKHIKLSSVCAKTGKTANSVIQQNITNFVPHNKKDMHSTKKNTLCVVTTKNSNNCDIKPVSHNKKARSKKVLKTDRKHKKSNKFSHFKKHKTSTTDIQHSGQKILNDNQMEYSPVSKEKQSCVVIPRKTEEISSNWKKLQQSLHIKRKKQSKLKKSDDESTSKNGKQQEISKTPDIWFDDVDEILIEASKTKEKSVEKSTERWNNTVNPLVKPHSFTGLTKVLAMDCEMVGTGTDGKDSIVARVSIVNQFGQCVYDKYVQPTDKVTDYRTQFSGIRPGDMEKGELFKTVQKEVHDLLKGRILVGHAIHNDLKVLFLDHPRKAIRDTSKYKPFRKLVQGRQPSLKKLSDQVLGVRVQEGEHNSVQDAQAAMRLYTMYRKQWEKEIKLKTKLGRYKVKLASAKEKLSVQFNATEKGSLDSDNDE